MGSQAPILLFLRPLGPPRPSTVRQFLRYSTSAHLQSKNDTLSGVTSVASSSSPQSSPSSSSDDNANQSADRPKRQRPAIPTLTVPPAPPPKRIQAGYAREAKAKLLRKPNYTPPSAKPLHPKQNRTAPPPPTKLPPAAAPSATHTAPDIASLPYFIQRVRPSGQLPVYHDVKAGKTLRQTRIRKVFGDARALRDELKVFLGIEKDKDCAVSAVTGHIVLKGHWRNEVDRFLVAKGF